MSARGSESWRRASRLGRSGPPGDRAGGMGDGSTVLSASSRFQKPERPCEHPEGVRSFLVFPAPGGKKMTTWRIAFGSRVSEGRLWFGSQVSEKRQPRKELLFFARK